MHGPRPRLRTRLGRHRRGQLARGPFVAEYASEPVGGVS